MKPPKGYKQTELGILPDDWKVVRLGEVSNIIKERVGKNNYTLLSVTAGYGLISQVEKFGKEIAGSALKDYIVIHKDDFAYNKSATKEYRTGYIALLKTYEIGAVPNSIFLCFRVDKKFYNIFFLEQLFKINYHNRYLKKIIQIGARAHGSLDVSNKDFLNMPIPLPPLKEQEKIAEILNAADLELSSYEKLIALKEKYKKGLMQKLLTPKIRFKEFKEQWKVVRLGEVLREVSVRNKDDRETNIISVTNTRGFTKQNEFFGKIVASKDTTNYKIIHKNQFAYNPARINVGSIALLKDFDIGILSPMYVVFECKHLLSAEYLNHWLKSYFFMGVLEDYLSGSVRKSLNFKDMEQISIFLPPLKEQQKIAEVLSSCDAEIQNLKDLCALLKKQKHALMQRLLCGKVRVKGT